MLRAPGKPESSTAFTQKIDILIVGQFSVGNGRYLVQVDGQTT